MCPNPDDLADETIDRVAARLAGGELIRTDLLRYVYGVARNVMLESWKKKPLQPGHFEDAPSPDLFVAERERRLTERQLDCFLHCLKREPESDRTILLRYYEHRGRQKIESRVRLADELAIPLGALRLRIHRIKIALQRCMERCVSKG